MSDPLAHLLQWHHALLKLDLTRPALTKAWGIQLRHMHLVFCQTSLSLSAGVLLAWVTSKRNFDTTVTPCKTERPILLKMRHPNLGQLLAVLEIS